MIKIGEFFEWGFSNQKNKVRSVWSGIEYITLYTLAFLFHYY